MEENIIRGFLGFKGEQGLSAYEVAVANGYTGSEQDWVNSLSSANLFHQYKSKIVTTSETINNFALPSQYTRECFLDVYVDGLHIPSSEYSVEEVDNGYEVVFDTDLESGQTVELIVTVIGSSNFPISNTLNADSTDDTASSSKVVYDTMSSMQTSIIGQIPSLSSIMDALMPVGYIYISTSATSPQLLFGGTWRQIKGRFLIGVGQNEANTSNYWGSLNANVVNCLAGEKGGTTAHNHTTSAHALTVSEMPKHTHTVTANEALYKVVNRFGSGSRNAVGAYSGYGDKINFSASQTGSGSAHSHGNTGSKNLMPPFLSVYMWEKTELANPISNS